MNIGHGSTVRCNGCCDGKPVWKQSWPITDEERKSWPNLFKAEDTHVVFYWCNNCRKTKRTDGEWSKL